MPNTDARHHFSPAEPGGEQKLRARDRVLLYTRGMDLDPLASVDLALESLHRAEEELGTHKDNVSAIVMDHLQTVLREHNVAAPTTNAQGEFLTSMPPINRHSMRPSDLDLTPIKTAVKKLLRMVFGHTVSGKKRGSAL